MSSTQAMLDTHPGDFALDPHLLTRAIDAMVECASTCTQCADACLAEEHVADMVACIRRNLDCADACTAAARILARQTAYDATITRTQLEACAAACKSCGDECARHGQDMAHCEVCADSCRRCEQACRELLAALG